MMPENHPRPGPVEPDDLERLLAKHSPRTPPADWREAILARAGVVRADREGREPINGARRPLPARSGWQGWWGWRDALSSGWTVTAAAWVLVIALNHYAMPSGGEPASVRPPLSDAAMAEIRAQQRLLVEMGSVG